MWTNTTLGELCKMYQPKTISAKEMVADGDYPVFGANGVIGRYDKYNHENPQLLVTCRGATCGSVNISEPFSWINGNAMVIQPDLTRVSLKYMEYLFRGGINLTSAITGAAQPQITRTSLEPIQFSYPPLAEQQRVVAKLDVAFAEIDRAMEIGIDRQAKTKNVFGQLVDIEMAKQRGRFEGCSLGEMLESVEYGTSTKCAKSGKYPVLRMGNMQSGKFLLDDLVYLDSEEELVKYEVSHGDVFFNRTNSALHVGKSAIYDSEEKCLFAGYLIRLNHSREKIDGRFLNYYLNAPSTRQHGYSVMTSSVNQSNINGTKLKAYPFFKIDLATQKRVSERLENIEREMSQVLSLQDAALNEYAKLKSAILAKELQPPLKEPSEHKNSSGEDWYRREDEAMTRMDTPYYEEMARRIARKVMSPNERS